MREMRLRVWAGTAVLAAAIGLMIMRTHLIGVPDPRVQVWPGTVTFGFYFGITRWPYGHFVS